MYTINEERKELRDNFYQKLVEEFRVSPTQDKLNESAYMLRGINRGSAIAKQLRIVKEIQQEKPLNVQEDYN